MLKDMNFEEAGKWKYDPYQVISKKRVQPGYVPYIHQQNLEVKRLAFSHIQGKPILEEKSRRD